MQTYISKTKLYIVGHKIISAVILIAILFGGYWAYGKVTSARGETRYVTAKVEKGTIISSVTGSGQVSALNSIDLKSKVSGTITYVGVSAGEQVRKGKTLFSIDNTNAQKAVRDAEINLQNAQLSLKQLSIQNSQENMNTNLAKSYDDGFNAVSNAFLDLPGIMTGLDNMFFKNNVGTGQSKIDWYAGQVAIGDRDGVKPYKQSFVDTYNEAKSNYDIIVANYKSISRTSDNATIESMILKTYDTIKLISDAVKNANNFLDFVNNSMQTNSFNIPAVISTDKASLNTYTSETNTALGSLLSAKTNIKNYKDAFTNNDLSLQSSDLSLKQKENTLQDAKNALADYYVAAPFDGTIASVAVQVGDSSSGTLGTIITKNKIATIPLNEVDVSKIQLGQKTTLTFDAIPDLTIAGKVVQIDSIGTVSQGVVNYNVKISFDTDDNRVKPGMSVSATIITAIKQDVLVVSNSAIKTQNNSKYVETFKTDLPTPTVGTQGTPSLILPDKITVETGLSNNTQTEIISGLKEGNIVVTKTITTTSSATASAPSLLNAVGGNRGGATGGTAARALGR